MSSKPEAKQLNVSWSNIEAGIEQVLRQLGAISPGQDVLRIALNYSGGYQPNGQVISVSLITKEQGVELIRCR